MAGLQTSKNKFTIGISLWVYLFVICIIALILTTSKPSAPEVVPDTNVASNVSVASQLADCMPKSDQASHDLCTRLIAGITSFDECVDAGFPVRESYPPSCGTPDGRNFSDQTPDPAVTPKQIKAEGELTCLPHKQTDGPITLECAFGLKTGNGIFYALDTSKLKSGNGSVQETGIKVSIEGSMLPPGNISSNQWFRYDIGGIISVTRVRKI